MKKTDLHIQPDVVTSQQIADLTEWWDTTKTQAVARCVDWMHRYIKSRVDEGLSPMPEVASTGR